MFANTCLKNIACILHRSMYMILETSSLQQVLTFRFVICCSEEKCEKSKKFAAEVGLPVLTNVLLPKTKGFCLCLETLRGSFDAGLYVV